MPVTKRYARQVDIQVVDRKKLDGTFSDVALDIVLVVVKPNLKRHTVEPHGTLPLLQKLLMKRTTAARESNCSLRPGQARQDGSAAATKRPSVRKAVVSGNCAPGVSPTKNLSASRSATQMRQRATAMAATLVAIAVVCASLTPAFAKDADEAQRFWPAWRGPSGTGVGPDASPPLRWSEDKNVRWKTGLPGLGHSTPVIWGKRIFLTTTVPAEELAVPNPR